MRARKSDEEESYALEKEQVYEQEHYVNRLLIKN